MTPTSFPFYQWRPALSISSNLYAHRIDYNWRQSPWIIITSNKGRALKFMEDRSEILNGVRVNKQPDVFNAMQKTSIIDYH